VRCVQLTEYNLCRLFGLPEQSAVTGAILREVCILAQYDSRFMMNAAKKLGLSIDVRLL
jgi:hypothetical protein